ncbi:MAG: Hpt domain-containing protein [Phycisphaerales bacterium]
MEPAKSPRPIISEFAGDPEMSELVRLFLGELPQRVRALEAAWREQQVQTVARMAHQLRGSSAGYGFPTIGSAAASLEESLRARTEADAQAVLERAAAEFRALVDLCSRACRPAA